MSEVSRLFQDKFDYLDCMFSISSIALSNSNLQWVCFIEEWFWRRVGFAAGLPNVEFVTCDAALNLDALDLKARNVHAIYAVQHASIGIPVVKHLIAQGVRFVTAGGANVGGYVYDDYTARSSIEASHLEQRLAGFSKFHDPGAPQDFVNLCQALRNTSHLTGDVVEVGCFRGSSGCTMLDYAKACDLPPRTFHFIDVFEGFNYSEAIASTDISWANTHATEGRDVVAARLEAKAGANQVTVRQLNVISDDISYIGPVSVCNIDVDLYEAVLAAMRRFAPLIVPGGIMICEDAGHTPALIGARVALDEFLNSPQGKTFTAVHMPSGQVFLVKHAG